MKILLHSMSILLAFLILTEGILWHRSIRKRSKSKKQESVEAPEFDKNKNPIQKNSDWADWNEINDILHQCVQSDKHLLHEIKYALSCRRFKLKLTAELLGCLCSDMDFLYEHRYPHSRHSEILKVMKIKYSGIDEKFLSELINDFYYNTMW